MNGRPVTRALVAGARRHPAFVVLFVAFVVWAYWLSYRAPLGPGQDQHYHLLGASITARWWWGDPAVRALYKFVDPLDANTFVYTFLFPFEAALGPLDAWRVGFTTLYFVGYPLACVAALHLLRRPLWGALLAFPLAYVKSWSQGGYMPFVSAAPFFVLAIALLHRVLEDGPPRRMRLLAGAAVCSLAFVAHAHVFTWLMVVLASLTVVALVRDLVVGAPMRGLAALADTVRVGLRALAFVLPSLLLFALWYWRTHRGGNAAHGTVVWQAVPTSYNDKVVNFVAGLVHVKVDEEYAWVAALVALGAILVLLSGRRESRELPTPEIAIALSFASFFVLPSRIGQQVVGFRHVDFVVWLLPLVLVPALPRSRGRAAVVLVPLVAFTVVRCDWVAKHMIALQKELAGLTQLAKPCPEPNRELAYVTFGAMSEVWHGMALHQAHETFAALCRLDAPVYDPTEYPHNLLPVRYRGKPPAPVTVIVDDTRWWAHPRLFQDFDFVLVRGWHPTVVDVDEVSKVAIRIRVWKEWQLWAKKPDLSKVP